MSTGLIPQTPEPDSYALASFAPSSRAVARATRRRTDGVLGLAEQVHQVAPAGDPYYQAIIRAYVLSAAQDIAEF